jgi:hypothetical protein
MGACLSATSVEEPVAKRARPVEGALKVSLAAVPVVAAVAVLAPVSVAVRMAAMGTVVVLGGAFGATALTVYFTGLLVTFQWGEASKMVEELARSIGERPFGIFADIADFLASSIWHATTLPVDIAWQYTTWWEPVNPLHAGLLRLGAWTVWNH